MFKFRCNISILAILIVMLYACNQPSSTPKPERLDPKLITELITMQAPLTQLASFNTPNLPPVLATNIVVVLPTLEPQATTEISWMKEGDWWEFGWTDYENKDLGESLKNDIFRITLGAPVEMEGLMMYSLRVSGNPGIFTPRWELIGADFLGRIVGVESGHEELVLIYDTTNQRDHPGAGFFANFAGISGISLIPGFPILQGESHVYQRNGEATQVGYRKSKDNCVRDPEIGIFCGSGEKYSKEEYEYWESPFNPVPVAWHYDYWYQNGSGMYLYISVAKIDISLISSSSSN